MPAPLASSLPAYRPSSCAVRGGTSDRRPPPPKLLPAPVVLVACRPKDRVPACGQVPSALCRVRDCGLWATPAPRSCASSPCRPPPHVLPALAFCHVPFLMFVCHQLTARPPCAGRRHLSTTCQLSLHQGIELGIQAYNCRSAVESAANTQSWTSVHKSFGEIYTLVPMRLLNFQL